MDGCSGLISEPRPQPSSRLAPSPSRRKLKPQRECRWPGSAPWGLAQSPGDRRTSSDHSDHVTQDRSPLLLVPGLEEVGAWPWGCETALEWAAGVS